MTFLVNLMRVAAYKQEAGDLYLGCLLGYIFGGSVYWGKLIYVCVCVRGGGGVGGLTGFYGISIKN